MPKGTGFRAHVERECGLKASQLIMSASARGSIVHSSSDSRGIEDAADLDSLIRFIARDLGADGAMLTVHEGLPSDPRIYSAWGLPLGRTILDGVSGAGSIGHALEQGKAVAQRLDSSHNGDARPPIVHGFVAPIKSPTATRGALTVGYASPIERRDAVLAALSSYASVLGLWLDNSEALVALLRASYRDGLTGCLTYPALVHQLELEMKRSARTRQPLSCLFIDLDGFERVNDTEGPLAGDRVLTAVAEAIRGRVRSTDSLARFGGDEFVVLLPDTSTLEAGIVADGLLDPIADATRARGRAPVTASVGLAELQAGMTPAELLDRADASLRQRRTTDTGQSASPV